MVPKAPQALLQSAGLGLRPYLDAALCSHGHLAMAGGGVGRGWRCETDLAGLFWGATSAQRAVDARILQAPLAGVGVRGGARPASQHSRYRGILLEGLQDGCAAARTVSTVDRLRVGVDLLHLAP